jgi:hypothetical protein
MCFQSENGLAFRDFRGRIFDKAQLKDLGAGSASAGGLERGQMIFENDDGIFKLIDPLRFRDRSA